MALDNKHAALRIPPKKAKLWNYVFFAIVTGLSNFLRLEKEGFSPEFSHTSELKFKVRLAVVSEQTGVKPKKPNF